MRCAGNADDVLVVGLDLWFNVFSLKLTLNVQCFLVESNSLLLKNGSFFSFFFFVLSFCKSNDIHKKINHGNKYYCCEHAWVVGWRDGAVYHQVPGRPTAFAYSRARACWACSRCGMGGLFVFISFHLIYPIFRF